MEHKPNPEHRVFTTVDGVTYSGHHSVWQEGHRVWIDCKEVGVECDRNGEPFEHTAELPIAQLPVAEVANTTGWQRFRRWFRAWFWFGSEA